MKEHDLLDYKKGSYNCDECADTGFCVVRGNDGVAKEDICIYCELGTAHEDISDYVTDLTAVQQIISNVGVTKLARETQISRQTLYNILNGVHELSHRHYLAIINAKRRLHG